MKKLSKKIISLVLALVMAMPMMLALPSTAITASADEICPAEAIAAPKSYNVDFWYINNQDGEKIPANYSSNIVYTNMDGTKENDGERCVWTDQTQCDHLKMKFVTPGTVVGVYDGVTKPSFPIVLETVWTTHAGGGEYICFIQPNANSDATWAARKINFRYDWYGDSANTAWNRWPSGSGYTFKGEANAQISRSNGNNKNEQSDQLGKGGTKSDDQNNTKSNRYWRNCIEYYGNFSDGSYSDTITNAKLLVGHVSKANGWFDKNWYYYSQEKDISNTFYVINYKPLYDILKTSSPTTINVDGFKNIRELRTYLTTGDGSWKYTEASRNAALTRMAAVGNFDLNNYDFDYKKNTVAAVSSASADIKTAYDNYVDIPKILVRQYKVTFKDYNNSEISHQYFPTGTSSSVVESAKPSLPAANYDETAHYTYAWNSACSNVTSDATYTQVRTSTPHSYGAYTYAGNNEHSASCSVNSQNHSKTEACSFADDVHAATASHNGYTDQKCSVCNHVDETQREYNPLVWTTYDAKVSAYDTAIASGNYTDDSVATCTDEVTAAVLVKADHDGSNTPQATVDTAANAIDAAVAKLDGRAAFGALDTAYANAYAWASDSARADDYTTSSIQAYKDYLDSTSEFKYEKTASRTNTSVSKQSEIDSEAAKYEGAQAYAIANILDPLADLSAVDRAYNKANALLISLDGKAPQYTEASINALISVVNSAKTDYINGDRSDIGKKANSKPDEAKSIALATSINNAIAGLETIEKDNPTTQEELDLSVYNEAVARINNLDPEAYDVNSESIETALRVVNENLLNEDIKPVEYGTSTINVLNSVNMTNIDNASFAILNALSNSIKHYDVITDANVTTGFKNGEVSSAAAPDENHKKSSVTYGASIVCTSENEDTAWFLSYSVGTSNRMVNQFQGKGKVFKGKVYGNTVIKAVQGNSEKCEVKIVRNYYDGETKESGEPVHYLTYVDKGESLTLPNKKAFPYYRCDGYFYTNGNPVEGNTISNIQSDIVIIAKYTKDTTLSYTIGVTGGTGAPADSVGYNTRVNLTGNAGTIGWLEKVNGTVNEYRPFYYGKDVSFLTTESVDLLATSDATKFENIPCINLRQSGAEAQIIDGVRKTTFNGQIVFDSDVFIVDTSGSEQSKAIMEYGILVGAARSTGGYVPDESQLTVENSGSHDEFGVLRAKSTKLVGANQFSITINNLPANYIYRGYVIYKDETGKMHTKYSPAVNV